MLRRRRSMHWYEWLIIGLVAVGVGLWLLDRSALRKEIEKWHEE